MMRYGGRENPLALGTFLAEAIEIKSCRHHRKAAVGVAWPLVLRPVPSRVLYPILVRIAKIQRLGNTVVGRPIKRNVVSLEPP